jgi:hypothetical protein
LLLRIAIWRRAAPYIHTSVCLLLIDIHLGFAHGIPYGLDPLVRLFTHDHFLNFAGTLFDYRLLMPFGDLEYRSVNRA